MGRTAQRLGIEQSENTGGRTSQRLGIGQPQLAPNKNILTSFIQSAVKPYLRAGETALRGGGGLAGLGLATGQQALGFDEAAQRTLRGTQQLVQGGPRKLGVLGEAEPIKTYGQAALTGGEIGLDLAGTELYKLGGKIVTKLGERAGVKNLAKITEMISPRLTPKRAAGEVASQGVQKTGLLRKIGVATSGTVKEIAETVQRHVPGFNPSKTIGENLNVTKEAVNTIAERLKNDVIRSGKNKIYTFKELGSRMDSVAKPIVIKSDQILSRQFDLVKNAALKIAKQKGGRVSNLLDARKAFDDLVEREFPNLYDRANAPMRQAVTAMRNVMNDFIAENVDDVAFKESLKIQHRLFSAIDNMADNISSGPLKELGTNAVSRFAKRHPGLTRVAKYATAGAAGALGIKTLGE